MFNSKQTKRDIIINDTHRGLLYEDGVLVKVLEAGYHVIQPEEKRAYVARLKRVLLRRKKARRPQMEVTLVDVRERELTIKGQEILTSDKVALRVSIIVQYRVTDPRAALQVVANYEERLYTDVQLAARRSLASMTLEDILTNRNKLSEDILTEVKEAAAGYGVAIQRADVKDLVFPGNLQEVMNRVLAAERMSQVQLVEARAKAETQKLEAQTRTEAVRLEAEAEAASRLALARAEAEAVNVQTAAEIQALRDREQAAAAYARHPALLRLRELETLRELSQMANARIYIGFDKHQTPTGREPAE
ncbi:MAG: slipin family protein [Acidobacteria bacterium]|nr:slipin family protein [Acidobacteriota bacterium]